MIPLQAEVIRLYKTDKKVEIPTELPVELEPLTCLYYAVWSNDWALVRTLLVILYYDAIDEPTMNEPRKPDKQGKTERYFGMKSPFSQYKRMYNEYKTTRRLLSSMENATEPARRNFNAAYEAGFKIAWERVCSEAYEHSRYAGLATYASEDLRSGNRNHLLMESSTNFPPHEATSAPKLTTNQDAGESSLEIAAEHASGESAPGKTTEQVSSKTAHKQPILQTSTSSSSDENTAFTFRLNNVSSRCWNLI